MDLKTVKLNCLTLGEWKNEPISKKVEYPFEEKKKTCMMNLRSLGNWPQNIIKIQVSFGLGQ